jgi:colanic acid/amylovoran biosynthesis glycosyltransferase
VKIAYITNQFPASVEWYVVDEISELRRRGVEVIACSAVKVQQAGLPPELQEFARETIALRPVRWKVLLLALWVCISRFSEIRDLLWRAVIESNEPWTRRIRTVGHTLLGAYYALLLRDQGVRHIHVHHGYFSSWIAMVAARLLGISFSLTLHGSDLLIQASRMDMKLSECKLCLTVSEFNRQHILTHYPGVDPRKIRLRRMGVDIPATAIPRGAERPVPPVLLAVGRLHPVKDHVFLLQACYLLREAGLQFRCLIVGEGPERRKLEFLIHEFKIEDIVTLVGHVPHHEISEYYRQADLVVLTSRSEGIPLVLMEAMAHERIVLAPAITGIPELVIDGKTGFLYQPGALEEFAWRVEQISKTLNALQFVRRAARDHVRSYFHRQTNLEQFADLLLDSIRPDDRSCVDADSVLQQI